MKKFSKILIISFCIVALFSTVAMGTIFNTSSGGTWQYGNIWSGQYEMGYSYYYHPDLYHGAYAAADGQSASGWVYRNAGYTASSNSDSLYYPYYVTVQCIDTTLSAPLTAGWYNMK